MFSHNFYVHLKFRTLPEVRAVASFEARLNIISQTLTLSHITEKVSNWFCKQFIIHTVLQGVLTCQSQQTLVCKLPTSRQRPPRQSSPPHSAGSQDPPVPQWCKTEEHHPMCCNKMRKKANSKITTIQGIGKRKEKGLQYCLPEICIRNVLVDKFIQRTVDDFVEVHCVLLLQEKIENTTTLGQSAKGTEPTVHNGH